eukprot:tig00021348_g20515.t1
MAAPAGTAGPCAALLAAGSHVIDSVLRETINYSVSNNLIANAVFLAERLHAQSPTDDSMLILANCYLRNQQVYRAYHLIKAKYPNPTSCNAHMRYLFAQCCFEMSKLQEAESVLTPPVSSNGEALEEVPNGAAGLHLLGQICQRASRRTQAIAYYSQALRANPFLWSAYEALCTLGADLDPADFFPRADEALISSAAPAAPVFAAPPAPSTLPAAAPAAGPALVPGTPARTPAPMDYEPTPAPQYFSIPPVPLFTAGAAPHTPATGLHEPHAPSPSPATGLHIPPDATPAISLTERFAMSAHTGPGASPTPSSCVTPAVEAALGTPAPVVPRRRGAAREDADDEGVTTAKKEKPRRYGGHRLSFGAGLLGAAAGEGNPAASTRRSTRLSTASTAAASTAKPPKSRPARVSVGSPLLDAPESAYAPARAASSSAATPGPFSSVPFALPSASSAPAAPASSSSGPSAAAPLYGLAAPGSSQMPLLVQAAQRPEAAGPELRGGVHAVLHLLRLLGSPLRALALFRCEEALAAFQRLPPRHLATGWALALVGRTHFEMVNYAEAERHFEWARQVDPHRVAGMETYSTILWHEKKEVQLAYLAQQLVALDKHAPQSWCVLGNCFSLQREHETALKFFQRAIQVDPQFTYAYTLAGHEYVANEDFDRALQCYRNAIRTDDRHYNAWYGLGNIYFRQEKYELAEYHFRRAIAIHPRSSVLYSYLGMVQHSNRKHEEAIASLDRAIEIDPKNPLARFRKASVLVSMNANEEAILELEVLKDVAPREATVYFMMGKIYKKLNRPELAMRHLMLALDLDPKDGNMIKAAIEKISIPENDEEEEI